MGQPKPMMPKTVLPILKPAQPANVTLTLTGVAKLRPQDTDQTLSASGATVMLDDDSLVTTVNVGFATSAEASSFSSDFPVMVLQLRQDPSGAWTDIDTFYGPGPKSITSLGRKDSTLTPKPTIPVRPELPKPGPGVNPDPTIPREPGERPRPKRGPPFDPPVTTVPGVSFSSLTLTLPAGTSAIRASARRVDGTSLDSPPLRLDVRSAPEVLTLLAMGGTCTDPDANTTHQTLADAGITRGISVCESKGVAATYLGDLTPMGSVNCNNPCNTECMNFLEHLALRIMNDKDLANELDSINNAGTQLCNRRTNDGGIRNRIIFGKWRSTEEEPVCSTPLEFNTMIDTFVEQGGRSLILIGQSQGGAKLAGMVRDHWRWGSNLTLELIVLWDATSFDVPNGFDTRHPGVFSMGVRKVGSKPKKVLTFFQYSNPVPFQNGAQMDPTEAHDDLEQHDLDECLSHNGIARSQFVHHRTTDVVKETLQAVRDCARS